MPAVPSPPPLHATVIMDYQNVHMVGHDAFAASWSASRHETLPDPLLFAEQLIAARSGAQRPGRPGPSSTGSSSTGACRPARTTRRTTPGASACSSAGNATPG